MATNYCPQCGHAVSAEDRFCPACGASMAGEMAATGTAGPSRMPVAILVLAAIGLLLIVGGFLLNGEDNTPAVAEPPVVPETARPENAIPFPEVPRIALDEAAIRQINGDAIFVDVREPADYEEAHIPNAISLPLGDDGLDPAFRELPQDAEIITYCTWPSEELSARAAQRLLDAGYTNVQALRGGFRAWMESGLATESGGL